MVSSTIYTNHSSSFSTTRIIWRNRICIGCSFHGASFDYHDSGMFRKGLGVVAHSSHNTVTTMTPSIIQTSMHWMHLRWRSRKVMIWYLDNKSPISINILLPYISNGQLSILDNVCLHFSVIGCFQTSHYFPPKSHLIVIFFSLMEFLVATA